MKKLNLLVMMFMMMVNMSFGQSILKGDMDDDGKLTIKDVTALVETINGKTAEKSIKVDTTPIKLASGESIWLSFENGVIKLNCSKDTTKVETIFGYYSFNATSKAEIKNLTESDFTKLTEATCDITCNKTCYPVFLTEGTTAPTVYCNSKTFGLGDPIGLKAGTTTTGTTKVINSKTYNVWYISNPTEETDTDFVRIIFK